MPVKTCDHDLAYGACCIHCGRVLTPDEVLAYMPDETPNRTWYEVYWPGPREYHACCDPWGPGLRGVAAPCVTGECGE